MDYLLLDSTSTFPKIKENNNNNNYNLEIIKSMFSIILIHIFNMYIKCINNKIVIDYRFVLISKI